MPSFKKCALFYFIMGINVHLVKGTLCVLGPSSGQLGFNTTGFKSDPVPSEK